MKRPSGPKSALAEAIAAAEAGRREHALEAMLAAWRKTRSTRLAELIEALGGELAAGAPVIFAGSKSKGAPISARVEHSGACDVQPVLDAVAAMVRTSPAAYGFVIELAERHPEDPRVATALYALIRRPPYKGTTGALYGNLVSALTATGDPRYLPSVVKWHDALEPRRRYIRRERADLDMLKRRADEVRRAPPHVEPAELAAPLERLSTALKRSRASGPSLETLFEAVYQAPDDLSRRLVLADALLDRGDVRGELISAQCRRQAGEPPSRRERELLVNFGRQWLGPLDPIIRKDGLAYRRGFVAAAREASTLLEQHPLLLRREWATVEELDLGERTWGDKAVEFADGPQLQALTALWLGLEDALRLRRRGSLTTLGLRVHLSNQPLLRELFALDVFPALHTLELEVSGDFGRQEELMAVLEALPSTAFGKPLRRLRFPAGSVFGLHRLAGVVPSVEVGGDGFIEARRGWSVLFSGPKLSELTLRCFDARPKLQALERVLATLDSARTPLASATLVNTALKQPERDSLGQTLARLGVTELVGRSLTQ